MNQNRHDDSVGPVRSSDLSHPWGASRSLLLAAYPLIGGLLFLALVHAGPVRAQSSGGQLNVQGLNQQHNPSPASRAFGGVTLGQGGRVGLMFVNPASMHALEGVQLSIAGYRQYRDLSQDQQFAPVRYYPNLSLLLEARTDDIPDPDPDLVGFTPADSVQRPFDEIQPRWSRSTTADVPLHALAAIPFSLGPVQMTVGAGAVQYADLDHYYQNNNVLAPGILEQRPLPTLRPTDDDPLTAEWYQAVRSRDGSINGYGLAVAGHVERYNLTLGASGLLLNGESDDLERRVERGELTFFANEFRADSSVGQVTRQGTSEFSGFEVTIGGTLHGEYVSLGFTVRPPTAITRTFDLAVQGETAGVPVSEQVSGEDELRLPWRGTVGLLLKPSGRLNLGIEYEMRPYADAVFEGAAGGETSPWQSASLFRIGTSYDLTSWLVVRGGIRGEADVFVPDGSAFADDPVAYRIFTTGVGLRIAGVQWDLTYEHADMNYQDIWGSALSDNRDQRHTLVTALSYTLPLSP